MSLQCPAHACTSVTPHGDIDDDDDDDSPFSSAFSSSLVVVVVVEREAWSKRCTTTSAYLLGVFVVMARTTGKY
jgi:hypothetical protein